MFPYGSRARLAAECRRNVYSSGPTAERWAKRISQQGSASMSHTIQEPIPAMNTTDTTVQVDREPGVSNRVSLRMIVRRALGVVEARDRQALGDDSQLR